MKLQRHFIALGLALSSGAATAQTSRLVSVQYSRNRRRGRASKFDFQRRCRKALIGIRPALPDLGRARRSNGAIGPQRERRFTAVFLAKKNPPPNIVYKRVTPRFFVVSSFRKGKIWYNRCNFSGSFVNCVLINYPAAEKRQWDSVVTRISNTLASNGG